MFISVLEWSNYENDKSTLITVIVVRNKGELTQQYDTVGSESAGNNATK